MNLTTVDSLTDDQICMVHNKASAVGDKDLQITCRNAYRAYGLKRGDQHARARICRIINYSVFGPDGFPELGLVGTLLWRYLAGAAFVRYMTGPTYNTPEAIAAHEAYTYMVPPAYSTRLDWLWSAEVALRNAGDHP